MRIVGYNNSSLVIDNLEKVGKRVKFSIAVFLFDDRTDTNIRFETESFIEIDEWQYKSKVLLLDHKLELEDFMFHAKLDQMNSWDNHIISNYNFFELSANINNSHLKFMIESADVFGKEFIDEINEVILYYPDSSGTAPRVLPKNGLIHVKREVVGLYEGGVMCDWRLELYSANFRMLRAFSEPFHDDMLASPKMFQELMDNKLDNSVLPDSYMGIKLSWLDGSIKGKGSLCDWAYPEHNELTFDDCVVFEWKEVDIRDLPIIS